MSVSMFCCHPQPPDGVPLEIKFDHHGWFAADHPTIVPRFDRNCLWSSEFKSASVGILNMYLPACEKPHMRMLT